MAPPMYHGVPIARHAQMICLDQTLPAICQSEARIRTRSEQRRQDSRIDWQSDTFSRNSDQEASAHNGGSVVQIIEKSQKMHGSLPATFYLSMQGLLYRRRSLCTPGQTISPPLHARPCTSAMSALPLSRGDWFTSAWLRDQAFHVGLHSPQRNTDAVNLREAHYSAGQTNAHPVVCHESTSIPSAHPCAMSKKMYKSHSSRYGLDYIAYLRELLATG